MKKLLSLIIIAAVFAVCLSGCGKGEDKTWYEDNDVIAHALGTVSGRTVTNSKEAFLQSYEDGFKLFEADFSVTSDNKLVVRHGFDEDSYYYVEQTYSGVMDYETFMSTPIRSLYTPLSAADLLELVSKHPDIYLITDTKAETEDEIKTVFTLLTEEIEKTGDKSLYSRIIVQLYDENMLKTVKDIYPFSDFIFTLYKINNVDYDKIGSFCKENGIAAVTVPSEYYTLEAGKTLHSYGLKIYVNTLDRSADIKWYYKIGADGIYTDYVKPEEYEIIVDGLERQS